MKQSELPTEAELAILNVVWQHGPSTVRKVHELLCQETKINTTYTTTLKLMQIMHQKGLLERDDSNRSHVYSPKAPRETMQDRLIQHLVHRAFSGSASKLVMQALSSQPATKAELEEIHDLLNEMEKKHE